MAEQEKAPRVAPKQAKAVTGKGPVAETGASKGRPPAKAPPPASSPMTKLTTPSVDYRKNRSTSSGVDLVSMQQQENRR